ncbi:hypothetical protein A4D02_08875 [Niastella koreensis]|uniref:Uncharacterized protein n=2 Tax=Niastella koreensis TaxID=354356 RepID=G8TQA4_NIAKG|nr:hypothetical protein [Niastella koreensis]AEW02118.1 hypothetical protein Niako_5888 [Niastella koreensis GR20-10]OQP48804.1 hypothetical protein A4D02_08875 [Niastella koreensis]
MKKIFSKKLAITLISSLTVGTGIVLACAGDWEEDGSASNFTPDAFVDSSYRPFFYSNMNFYYGIGHDTQHDTRFNESNVNDWGTYLGSAAPRTELEQLLRTATEGAIDSAAGYTAGKVKSLPSSMQSFQLFKRADKKTIDFLTYLSLAKKSEVFAVNNLDYEWDYDSKKKNPYYNAKPLNTKLLQEFTKATDPFLKQRYWFQLERSYFFNDSAKAILFFETNEKAFPKNELYYRTMAYAAGAYYKSKNYSKANYYYSKVYDGSNALKTVAHYSFHPQEENDWKATLALCANNDEKATLWQMLGIFYGDQKRAMQEIYTLNPASEKLNLLLARAVNNVEESFISYSYNSATSFAARNDTAHTELYALINRIAQAGNTSQPAMWNMASGYLYMLNGNTQKAAAAYAQTEKKPSKEKAAREQLRLLKLMNTIAGTTKADSKLEKAISPDLEWLTNDKSKIEVRTGAATNWIKQILCNRYKQQQELVKAACFNNYKEFYEEEKNIEAMKSFLSKPDKTPYEALTAKQYPLTVNDLLEYQAIKLTYKENLTEAIGKMETAASKDVLPGNPFTGRLQDCHDCDHEAPQKIKYTKLALLKKMKEMTDKVNAGTDVYTNAMLLANAYYNITWYGNARAFYDCKVDGPFYYSVNFYENAPSSMELASKYYTLGLQSAKTDEQKAKCHFMLAKCERNKYYDEKIFSNKDYRDGDHGNQPDFLAWNGFVSLKQYANTQFYKEAIKECGYFRTYTRK